MLKLKNSGYSKKYRMEILRSALLAFDKMLEDNKNNVKPLFRKRSWNKEEREAMKVNKKVNWYKNAAKGITYRSVLFVPPTPGGVLAKELRKIEVELNKCNEERIKIVEKGGIKVGNIVLFIPVHTSYNVIIKDLKQYINPELGESVI